MITFDGETFDDLHGGVLGEVLTNPEFSAKDGSVREALSVTMRLRDPLGRTSSSPTRDVNYGPVIGAFLHMFTANEELAKRRQKVVKMLERNASARDVFVADHGGSTQLFIRDGRLFLNAMAPHMDAMSGLTHIVFAMGLMHEIIMLDLREAYPDLALGDAVFSVGSLYLYERQYELAEAVAGEPERRPYRVPAIERREDVDALIADEAALRTGRLVTASYRGGAAWMFDKLLAYRLERDAELAWPRTGPTLAS